MLIKNVGKHAPRHDHILNTSRVWHETGSVLEVPKDEAAHYLSFPDVWQETTEEREEELRLAREKAGENVAKAMETASNLSSRELEELKTQIDDVIKRRKEAEDAATKRAIMEQQQREAAAKARKEKMGEKEAPKTTEDPEGKANRMHKIALAINDMDDADPDQYNGWIAKPEKVSEIAGFEVTEHECALLCMDKAKKADLLAYAEKIGMNHLSTHTLSLLKEDLSKWEP